MESIKLLKVGDPVWWCGSWGDDQPEVAVVQGIEINCEDKCGDEAAEVAWSKVRGQSVIVNLDNGHWAYGYQIKPRA